MSSREASVITDLALVAGWLAVGLFLGILVLLVRRRGARDRATHNDTTQEASRSNRANRRMPRGRPTHVAGRYRAGADGRCALIANTKRSPSGVATLLNCAGPPTPGGNANSTRGVPDSIPAAVSSL